MNTYTVSELRRLLNLIKTGAISVQSSNSYLMPFIETESRVEIVFNTLLEEDSTGVFYCMILLQNSIKNNRTEEELDDFVCKIERIMEMDVCKNKVQIKKLASIYATLALFYWPVKINNFLKIINGYLNASSIFGVEVLTNFLDQVNNSLEITEERRYELKKSLSAIATDLFNILLNKYSISDLINVIILMSRLGIIKDDLIVEIFKRNIEFTPETSELIKELAMGNDSELFKILSQYIFEVYKKEKTHGEIDDLDDVLECIFSIGDQTIPKYATGEVFDELLRIVLYDSVAEREKENMSSEVLLRILKVFISRVKGRVQTISNTSTSRGQGYGHNDSQRTERPEEIKAVLGNSPSEMFLSLCNLHLSLGTVANDTIVRCIRVFASVFPQFTTEFLEQFNTNIPLHISEALLKHATRIVRFTQPYLILKQSAQLGEYDIGSLLSLELKTSKECMAAKDVLEEMKKKGIQDPNVVLEIYKKALELSSYYSLDLAVSCGVLLEDKQLILHTLQDFQGKGMAAFVSAISKCPEVVSELFGSFQVYFLEKQGDLTNEIDAITKVLEQSKRPALSKDTPTSASLKVPAVDAIEILGKPVIGKIFSSIGTSTFHALKKITKILPFLLESTVHTAFITSIWQRIKKELEKQLSTGDYENNNDIQTILNAITATCTFPEEAPLMYEIVEKDEYPIRGVLTGIKKLLESSKGSQHQREIEVAVINMLVAIYIKNTEESTRATVAGLLSETPERLTLMESIYQIDLSEVKAVKEKKAAIKRVLRRIEGMREKHGAILQKPTTHTPQTEENRWTDISTPFN
ncbi:hypothetical protein NEOKW01_2060 [Nematocida sp. AWRm80]|nr:hypothetical protein NEOKW01_2060 [Nematocida sp. AWRm80]